MTLPHPIRPPVVALALALAASGALAQSRTDDGIPLGPWLLSPSFEATYTLDDNVRRVSDQFAEDQPTERIASSAFYLDAELPFRNSSLELSYGADLLDYAETELDSDLAEDFGIELQFRLSNGFRITLSDEFTKDFARIETLETVDRGGELTFIGEPFRINSWSIRADRADPRGPGFMVELSRTDFNYQGDALVDFFDYRGFENAYEYRHPFVGDRMIVLRFDTRHYDHYDPTDPVGVAFREEKAESVQLGLLGELGEGQPFAIRFGWGRSRYEQLRVPDTEFVGLVGSGNWVLRLGDRTKLELEIIRRSLPSNFDTYYVYNAAKAEIEREIVRSIEGSLALKVGRNRYGDPVFNDCGGGVRDDTRWSVGGDLGWKVHPRFGFKLSAEHEQRGSNCGFAEYDTTTVGMAIRTGWF